MKLKEGRLRLDVRGKLLRERVVRCWNSCPERLWSPSLVTFQTCLDVMLGSVLWVTQLEAGGWTG